MHQSTTALFVSVVFQTLTLSQWATRTVQSVTEFRLYPFTYGPSMISIKKQDVPVICKEDIDLHLLENLLQQQLSETEPDIISELQTVISSMANANAKDLLLLTSNPIH